MFICLLSNNTHKVEANGINWPYDCTYNCSRGGWPSSVLEKMKTDGYLREIRKSSGYFRVFFSFFYNSWEILYFLLLYAFNIMANKVLLHSQFIMRTLSCPPFADYRVWWSLADTKYGGTGLLVKRCYKPLNVRFSFDQIGDTSLSSTPLLMNQHLLYWHVILFMI